MDENNWIIRLAQKAIRIARVNKLALGNNRQDLSRPVLEDLMQKGYQLVTWDSGNSTHSTCIDLDKQIWELPQFLSGLQHDAPLFEKSHPGDASCTLIVSGEGLPSVRVDSFGNAQEGI